MPRTLQILPVAPDVSSERVHGLPRQPGGVQKPVRGTAAALGDFCVRASANSYQSMWSRNFVACSEEDNSMHDAVHVHVRGFSLDSA